MPPPRANPRSASRCWVVTASDLLEGDVIYLGHNGRWQRQLAYARLFHHPEHAEEARCSLHPDTVIGAYVSEMDEVLGRPLPRGLRERLRSLGPGNRPLGKQMSGSS